MDFHGTERYQVQRRLGRGGMGVVYEVYDRVRRSRVALKTLHRVNPQALFRFKREFRSLQDVQHPNLVHLGELATAGDTWFFTMELVKGIDLGAYLRCAADYRDTLAFDPNASTTSIVLDVHGEPDSEGQCESGQPGWDDVTPVPFDEHRVRGVFCQLARGLRALHAAGKIHRDIKPANVLVTPQGRVVILDLGLVLDLAPNVERSADTNVVGTVAYMAPEQANGTLVGPAADCYSVGTMLYEVLTGELPFTGPPLIVLSDKQTRTPLHPRAVAPWCPEDLADLCAALMHLDPQQRPTADDIIRGLTSSASSAVIRLPTAVSEALRSPLVGREQELAVLRRAYADVQLGAPVAVSVTGESGVGKSALLRHFAGLLKAESDAVVVLWGGCYERESMPYKAVDGVVDALARYLNQLPSERAAALVPRHADLLVQVFPVLGCVGVLAEVPRRQLAHMDSRLLRERAFCALRELFQRLCDYHPLVVIIDDLQWADADSIALLDDLLRPPEAPALLWLTSQRCHAGDAAEVPTSGFARAVRHVRLGPLADPAARELATWLLAHRPAAAADLGAMQAVRIVAEAQGHPLYIHELVHHASMPDAPHPRHLRIEAAIWSRVAELPQATRRVLALIAVAGVPLPEVLLEHAAGMSPEACSQAIASLRSQQLVRGLGCAPTLRIEPYHDQVRAAVSQHLSAGQRRTLHGQLARALESSPDTVHSPMLVQHLEAAGAHAKAAAIAEIAADAATATLAFDRAAAMLQSAIRLGDYRDSQLRALQVKLAKALVHAGRNAEAAALYGRAAEGAAPLARIAYRGKVAEHLLVSGNLEGGLRALREVLGENGIAYASSERRAMASIVWHRAKLRRRGLAWTPRAAADIAPEDLARLGLYRVAVHGLITFDTIRVMDFIVRGLLLALELGEPRLLGEFLLFEYGVERWRAIHRTSDKVDNLLETATGIAESTGDALLNAMIAVFRWTTAFYAGAFRDALACIHEAETVATRGIGVGWEVNVVRVQKILLLRRMGALQQLETCYDTYVDDARRRRDRFTEMTIRGLCHPIWLAHDEPERVRRDLQKGVWVPPEQGFHPMHWVDLEARVHLALYWEASAEIAGLRSEVEGILRSSLRWIRWIRINSHWLNGLLALVEARKNHAVRSALRVVRRSIRRLDREGSDDVRVMVLLLRAGAQALQGNSAPAAALFAQAASVAETAGLLLYAASARRRQGEFLGGDPGAVHIAAADAWMRSAGIRAPSRMTNLVMFGPPLASPISSP